MTPEELLTRISAVSAPRGQREQPCRVLTAGLAPCPRRGPLSFAFPQFLRHRVASLKAKPRRSGSLSSKVRWESDEVGHGMSLPYVEPGWSLLVIRVSNANSDKLHVMENADPSSSFQASSNPGFTTGRDLERVHVTCQISVSSRG